MNRLSSFARALRTILDDTGLLNRTQWGELLGVSEQAISQWVNDQTLPRPEILRMIASTFAYGDAKQRRAVKRLYAACDSKSSLVSPRARRLAGSLGDYFVRPLWDALQMQIVALPTREKELVLKRASEVASKLLHRNESKVSDATHSLASDGDERLNMSNEAVSGSVRAALHASEMFALSGATLYDLIEGARPKDGDDSSRPFCYRLDSRVSPAGSSIIRVELALWVMPPGTHYFNPLSLNEIQMYVLSGNAVIDIATGAHSRLGTSDSEKNLVWLGSQPGSDCPPLRYSVEGGAPFIGLTLFYSRAGIVGDPTDTGSAKLAPIPSDQATHKSAEESLGGQRSLAVFSYVASDRKRLTQQFSETPQPTRNDRHDVVRAAGQLEDRDLDWQQPEQSLLKARLVRFNALSSPNEDRTCLVWHEGYEVIVPILGRFQFVSASPLPTEVDRNELRFEAVGPLERVRRELSSCEASGLALPHILCFSSAVPHGFYGLGGADSHALLMRVLLPTSSPDGALHLPNAAKRSVLLDESIS